jgi:phosphoribosyl 1,2-cyclic phosphodiesterase
VKIDDVLLTHSHFDHVKDLPLLADVLVGRRDKPVTIWATRECITDPAREPLQQRAVARLHRAFRRRRTPVFKLKASRAARRFRSASTR